MIGVATTLCAQTGSITGTIKTSDDQPAQFVNVYLKGTNKGTTTDTKGLYAIKNIEPGTYSIVASFIGLETKEISIEVKAGSPTVAPEIVLNESSTHLQEIVVSGDTNQLAEKESNYVSRMPLKNLENPQVYSVVNAKIIEQQVITNFDDALKSASGVVSGGSAPGVRSYSYLRGFDEQAFFRNGKMLGNWTENDMANIENIEVIKGPSGTLFGGHGRANYGGVVNRITKKPYDKFGGNLSLTSGNYGYNRFTVDLNSPLNRDSTLSGRVNAAYRKEKSFQDYGWAESFFVAPAFSYRTSKRLTINVDVDLFKIKGASQGDISASGITNANEINRVHSQSFTSNEITFNKQSTIVSVDAIYMLNDHWTSTTSYGYSYSLYDIYYIDVSISGETVNRGVGSARYDIDFTNIQQYVNGDFKIGGMRNRLVAGVDYLRDDEIYVGGYAPYDTFSYNVVTPYISKQSFETAIVNKPAWNGGFVNDRYSVYASNVLDITNHLHLMTSLRYEYSKEKSPSATLPNTNDPGSILNQGAWTPKLGLVYEVLPNQLSLFGNYMGGTKNVSSFLVDDGTGNGKLQKASPERARQWEVGVKSSLYQDKLSIMASYFDIQVDNKLRTDPSNQEFSLQDGTQAHKGFEAELFANPTGGLDMMLGYANLDATFLNGTDEGKHVPYTPKNTINYWISYTLTHGKAEGLGIGFGGNYRGDSFLSSDNIITIPSVHTLNASVFYDQLKYRIALKADNLTDEIYWGDYFNAQSPRTIKASLSFKF